MPINLTEAEKLAPNWDDMAPEQQLSWTESELGKLMQANHPWNQHGYEDLMAARMNMLLGHRKILRNAIEKLQAEAQAKAEQRAFIREIVGLRAKAVSLMNGAPMTADKKHVNAIGKAIEALQGINE